MNKLLILNKLSEYYTHGNDTAFAKKLGITPQNLSNWKARNKIDFELVYTKCVEINAEWLLSGIGPMLKNQVLPTIPQQDSSEKIKHLELLLEEKEKRLLMCEKLLEKQEKEIEFLHEEIRIARNNLPNHSI